MQIVKEECWKKYNMFISYTCLIFLASTWNINMIQNKLEQHKWHTGGQSWFLTINRWCRTCKQQTMAWDCVYSVYTHNPKPWFEGSLPGQIGISEYRWLVRVIFRSAVKVLNGALLPITITSFLDFVLVNSFQQSQAIITWCITHGLTAWGHWRRFVACSRGLRCTSCIGLLIWQSLWRTCIRRGSRFHHLACKAWILLPKNSWQPMCHFRSFPFFSKALMQILL